MPLYTRHGDCGTTSTATGSRISKSSPAIEMSGAFDEALTRIGAAVVKLDRVFKGGWADAQGSVEADIHAVAVWSQHRLFTCAACVGDPDATELPISAADVTAAERYTDRFMSALPPMRTFVLPGSTELCVRLDLARSAIRAAERSIVRFGESGSGQVTPEALCFLNRLSDLYYAMARAAASAFEVDEREWEMSPTPPALSAPEESA